MKSLLKGVLSIIGLLCLLVIVGLWMCLDHYPLIEQVSRLSPQETKRAKQLFAQHDPRYLRDGEIKTLSVSQYDLQILSKYFIHFLGSGGAQVRVEYGTLNAQFTLRLPQNPIGTYLNVEVVMVQGEKFPHVDDVRVGQLKIPTWIADGVFQQLLERADAHSERHLGKGIIRNLAITKQGVTITYQWDSQLADGLKQAVISEEEQQRIRVFHFKLVEVMAQLPDRRRYSLVEVMQPLFSLAGERAQVGKPELENRAAILVLAAFAKGSGIRPLVPAAQEWPMPIRHKVTLRGRVDWAQHFIISAALAVVGGDSISDAIGLFKEVEDSRGGSGFSFADLAADKAGTRFGTHATSPRFARDLQDRLANAPRERDLVPRLADLPEWLSEREWIRRFGGLEDPKYQAMVEDIERRIEMLPLYREESSTLVF